MAVAVVAREAVPDIGSRADTARAGIRRTNRDAVSKGAPKDRRP
jgi:hypothetical protein